MRVFGVLGPTQAAVEMLAFLAVLLAAGWSSGQQPPNEALMAASGTAFAAVVLGQVANVFACRSTTAWPGALGWRTNRLLLVSVGVELGVLAVLLGVPPIATLLQQAPPTPLGWTLACLAAAAVLAADAAHKALRRRFGSGR
jgi:hypothetical protein